MEQKIDQRLTVAVVVLVTLLVADAWLSYRNTQSLNERAAWVSHSLEVEEALAEVRATVTDAQANVHAYLIQGDSSLLVPYRTASELLEDRIDRVASLTSDNPTQQARVSQLRQAARVRMDHLDRLQALRRNEGFDPARRKMAAGEGGRAMDAFLSILEEMVQEEKGLLGDREAGTRGAYRMAILSGLLAAFFGLGALAVVVWLGRRLLLTRTRAAQRLDRERERLRVSLASIGDAVISVDTKGRVDFMNPAGEALTGWSRAEAQGQPLEKVFSIINEESRLPVDNPVSRVLREGLVVGLANHTLLVARDGTERPIEDSAAPIKDAAGAVTGVILIFHDVTEKRQTERKIRESEESFRSSFELAAVGKVQVDPATGRFLRVNRRFCEITGYSAEELRALTPRDITHPDDCEEDWRRIGRMLRGEDALYTNDVRYVRKDGSAVWVSVTSTLIRDGEGRPVRTIGVVQDLTDRKRLEDQLREHAQELSEANRQKDQFLAMLAHELRNPLAPIRNALQVLKSSRADREAVSKAQEMMERQVVHMARIMDDLLDVSRMTRGQVELRLERVDLARLVRHGVEDHQVDLERAGLGIQVEVPEVPVWVQGDPTRLTQVIDNLLNNAVKFTPPGGTVSVRLDPGAKQGQVELLVRDTGIGIEPEMLPHLFQLFFQADRSLDRSKGGLGLGLALVKGLVQLHGGEVHAASAGPGRGAELMVRLPMQPEPAAITGLPARPGQTAKKLRILVVEDNRDAADSLKILLELSGYEVSVAYTGPAGVSRAMEWGPDVVLCDIGLPGLDGYGVVRELRRAPSTARARIIAITGYGGDQDRERSQEAGFDAHLTKPADPVAIQELLAAT